MIPVDLLQKGVGIRYQRWSTLLIGGVAVTLLWMFSVRSIRAEPTEPVVSEKGSGEYEYLTAEAVFLSFAPEKEVRAVCLICRVKGFRSYNQIEAIAAGQLLDDFLRGKKLRKWQYGTYAVSIEKILGTLNGQAIRLEVRLHYSYD